jgi:hypothetical protein
MTGRACVRCWRSQPDGAEATLPKMPLAFWQHDTMRTAFASRRIGQVIRYRTHPHHSRQLPQQAVAEALRSASPG